MRQVRDASVRPAIDPRLSRFWISRQPFSGPERLEGKFFIAAG
jgi:hypothetical protein